MDHITYIEKLILAIFIKYVSNHCQKQRQWYAAYIFHIKRSTFRIESICK